MLDRVLDGAVERRAVAGKEHVGVELSEGGQGTECAAPVVVIAGSSWGPCGGSPTWATAG
ncbi:hypothetical protein [Streptomyces avermitilis]|uniref:hypothetical protein n=1 Tax=Streptomyces avermitilis TaxID=33903 RepID=UPI0036D121BC